MILYRKAPQLRIQRNAFPVPPYWAASFVSPYAARRGSPLAIDYFELRAASADRSEVAVCDDVRAALEKAAPLAEPVIVEATGSAEAVFRRGEQAVRFCCDRAQTAVEIVSTDGALPASACDRTAIVIAAWPLQLEPLRILFSAAHERGIRWGAAVPVIFPMTTDLQALGNLADLARQNGASFLTALPIDLDPTARKAIAQTLAGDRERYDMLFHADLEPLHVATERHIAALAAEIGADDFIVPPKWDERSNWNAAILLTLAATRMIAMKHDVETASRIARSARIIAQLDKPLERIAAAASLSIIDNLDDISIDVLSDWLEGGRSTFLEHINKQWRLRRDVGLK